VDASDGRVHSDTVEQSGSTYRIVAKQYIDSTSDGVGPAASTVSARMPDRSSVSHRRRKNRRFA